MFFDRPDNRKQIELAYRKQLKTEIESKPTFNTPQQRDYHPQTKQFALIANIQAQQQQRKNKQEQYYAELRDQRQLQLARKQKEKERRRRQEQIQDQKIRRENEVMRERYQEQIKKQKKKGQPRQQTKEDVQEFKEPVGKGKDRINKSFNNENDKPTMRDRPQKLKPLQLAEKTPNSDAPQFTFTNIQAQPKLPAYATKIQNQTFNYISRGHFRDNYIRQLLGERKRMEEQISGISMLNRLFQGQRMRKKEDNSRGLEDLRALQKMLDDKSASYMESVPSHSSNSNKLYF